VPEIFIFLLIAIAYIVGQRLIRTWVAQRWLDDQISNVGVVLIILATSGFGLSLLFITGMLIFKPSGGSLGGLMLMLFVAVVVFGFLMTAINYASTHGVREHLRQMREQQERTKKL
jgi:hypothetical protein